MKTAVITGSTRGLGFEMAKQFCMKGVNVVINGVNEKRLEEAADKLRKTANGSGVEGLVGNVASPADIRALGKLAVERFGRIDIWINNAGVNQPMKAIWELTEEEIGALIDIDLKGAVLGSRTAKLLMEQQTGGGFIYNVEGYGSNDAMMLGFNMYGTSKRAVTHFTRAFAGELAERGSSVKAGRLSPGMMYTDFMTQSLGGRERIELPKKTRKFYNIMGDPPEVVAEFLVGKMLANTRNNAHIEWLTQGKVFRRLLAAPFSKKKKYFE
jgi:NAD(P)-dependent dehydrogenase (short-subunit alcohol dehydrogenase family)